MDRWMDGWMGMIDGGVWFRRVLFLEVRGSFCLDASSLPSAHFVELA